MDQCLSFLQPLNQVVMTKCMGRDKKGKAKDKTPIKQKLCYGVGHVFNDLCIQAWFSYIIIYFTKVVKLSSVNVGYIFLASQLADACSTPFIGYACDKQISKKVGQRYGNRKVWHLFGCAGIAIIWPFLFSRCLLCDENTEEWKVVLYYGLLTALFNCFWPMVEISHLSLMPHVARRARDALELGAIRSGLKLACGVYIYVVTWILLGQDNSQNIDESVQKPFTYQTLIVIVTGGFFAILFHWGVDEVGRNKPKPRVQVQQAIEAQPEEEPARTNDSEKQALEEKHLEVVEVDHLNPNRGSKTLKQWLKTPDLYIMMMIYMVTQNVLNLAQSYFPLYLTQTMQFPKEAIAYFPLIILISGIVSSFSVKLLNRKFSNRVLYCFGCVITIGSAAWFFFTPMESRNAIYAPTIIMGWGMSLMVVTSLALVADLIGEDKHCSGLIYAGMAFVDKLSLGLIVLALQESFPHSEGGEGCEECSNFVRTPFAVIPGIEALIGFVLVAFFFQRRPFQNLRKKSTQEADQECLPPPTSQPELENDFYDERYFRKIDSLRSTDV